MHHIDYECVPTEKEQDGRSRDMRIERGEETILRCEISYPLPDEIVPEPRDEWIVIGRVVVSWWESERDEEDRAK